ncbi:MAG TPA: hypothetical protein VK826_05980 [Bacteroidia bacterium]|nr:hypothetical protein [Bacteroidia bacterium]
MEIFEELKKWTDSLTIAEKRFIKLLGKARSGTSSSQQLELFDWLNKSDAKTALPAGSKLLQNLHTVTNRLKDLILDSLRILYKEDNTDAILRTLLDELAILCQKNLFRAASRHVKRAKKLALETSRYDFALQCTGWERKIAQATSPGDVMSILRELRKEEIVILKKQSDLLDLHDRHDQMVSLMRQFSFRQDSKISKEIMALSSGEQLNHLLKTGNYLEQALAVNIFGLRELYKRQSLPALKRYEKLLLEWQQHPEWQRDQTPLLILISKFYQIACFYAPLTWKQAQHYLKVLSGFNGLPPDTKRDIQRMLYHNQFTLALNMGKFDSVHSLIPEIDQWVHSETKHLTEAQTLPFLCNFSVAEFLYGNLESANRFVTRILNTPNRKVRVDIREFALVLQALLQYEMGNENLNEYLTRSGKRHFSKNANEINFEMSVFKHLDVLLRKGSARQIKDSLTKLIGELDELAQQTQGAVSFLGLNEIRMWAQSKQEDVSLRTIFLREVQKSLAE